MHKKIIRPIFETGNYAIAALNDKDYYLVLESYNSFDSLKKEFPNWRENYKKHFNNEVYPVKIEGDIAITLEEIMQNKQ